MKSKNTEPLSAGQVYQYALRLLTGRDYTVAGLKLKLESRNIMDADLETVLSRLCNEGWLDDARYAGRFAEAALTGGRYFGARLRAEMRRRGFSADIVQDALAPLLAEKDEIFEVKSVLQRRYPGFCYSAADERDKRKVLGFLQRRGFGFSAIIQALRAEG